MAYFASLAIAISIALTMFLTGTHQSFSNFHNQGQALRNWNEMALASSTTVARRSSTLLADLHDSYQKSLTTYKESNSADQAENSRRLRLLEEFADSLDIDTDSDLKRTVEFGLNHEAQLSEDPSKFPNRYTGYQVRLIHSNHIPVKLEASDKTYRSTLLSSSSEQVDLESYLNRCRHNEKIKIKRSLLDELVGVSAAETIATNPEIFATKVSDSGISLASLPNGLEIDIEMDLPGNTDEGESKVVKKSVTKRSTAQLRLDAEDIDLDLNFSCTNNLIGLDSRCPCLTQHIGIHANCPCQLSNRGVLAACPCRDGDYGNTGGCPCRPGIDAACTNIADPNGGGGPHSNTSTGQLQNLELKIIPSDMMKKFGKDRLGIFYDPNKPVDANNPIRIVNIDRGGYFALYQEPNGFLNISLGAIPFKSNGLKQLKDKFNPRELNLEAGVKFTIYDPSSNSNSNKVDVDNLTIDVLPRARKRYGHPNQYATIGGVPLTPRHLIVGTRRKDLTDVGRPSFGQFGNFRAYDPDTGALVGIFSHDQVKKECGNCFDFKYTEQGNAIRNGARVYQNFNSAEILKLGESDEFNSLTPENQAYKANNIWLNIQSDLASDTQMAINSGQNSWTKRILRDLNSQERMYVEGIFKEYKAKLRTKEYVMKKLGFKDNVAHKDDIASRLYFEQYNGLTMYANGKTLYWDTGKNQEYLPTLKKQQINFEARLNDYNNYIRNGTIPSWLSQEITDLKEEEENKLVKEEETEKTAKPKENEQKEEKSGKKIDCSKKKNRDKKACKGNKNNNKNGNRGSNANASKNQNQSNAGSNRNNNSNRGNQNSNRRNSNKGNGKKNKNKNKKGKGGKKKR